MKTFTAYLEWDPRINLYVGFVPGIPGAYAGKKLRRIAEEFERSLGYILGNIEMPAKICRGLLDSSKSRWPGESAARAVKSWTPSLTPTGQGGF